MRKKTYDKKNNKSAGRSGGKTKANGFKGSKRVFDKANDLKGKSLANIKGFGGDIVTGRIDGNNRGFAFLLLESGDLYIPREKLNGARHGDTVKAVRKGDKAEVVEILVRSAEFVVGTYYESGGRAYVLPDNKHFNDIPVKKTGLKDDSFYQSLDENQSKKGKPKNNKSLVCENENGNFRRNRNSVCDGDKVVVAFKPDGGAAITEILGKSGDEGTQLKSIMRSFGFSDRFSRAVTKNALEVCKIDSADLNGREDFREDIVFTIDGEDSRDFDDAVSIKKIPKGYILKVHIADVAHYVTHNSPLDKEAYNRATSVYFPFGAVPMLPPALSDDICSLKQDEDRLTLSIIMHVDDNGEVYKHRLAEGVIRSKARLTYPLAAAILDGNVKNYLNGKDQTEENPDELTNGLLNSGINSQTDFPLNPQMNSQKDTVADALKLYKSLALPLKHMHDLCIILLNARRQRGAIEFESDEPQIIMDGANVRDVKKAQILISHRIIEEFMVLANRTVARHFSDLGAPFVYRIHAAPPPEKLERLTEFLQKMGLELSYNGDAPQPADFAALLDSTPAELKEVVSTVALRAMSKAEYSPQCKGHYGLSLQYYCHFTSPIRRYPDLVIHRIIKAALKDEPITKFKTFVQGAAVQSSVKERLAEDAERKVNDFLIAQFMSGFVGEMFIGTVSGITEWGIFVRLNNTAEGLVRADSMRGLYRQEGYGIAAVGDKWFRLGQRMNVKMMAVSGDKIEFSLEEN